eukprot:scaffold174972_cov49-Attheya_sp.AAC.1
MTSQAATSQLPPSTDHTSEGRSGSPSFLFRRDLILTPESGKIVSHHNDIDRLQRRTTGWNEIHDSELLATDPSSNRENVAPVDAVFSLDASKHDVTNVKIMEMERDPLFECLDFSNMHRKKDIDRR